MDDLDAFSVGTIEDVVAVLGSTGQHPYLAAAGLTDDGDARDETVRLTRPLVVEGTEFTAALAALHATDAEASTRVLITQEPRHHRSRTADFFA